MPEPKTAKVRNVSGEDLSVGWLNGRLVLAGQAVEVPLEDVFAYTSQPGTWEPYDPAAKKITKDGHEAEVEREAAELAIAEPEPAPAEQAEDTTDADKSKED